jgi:hypothetical protein
MVTLIQQWHNTTGINLNPNNKKQPKLFFRGFVSKGIVTKKVAENQPVGFE